MTMMNNKGIEFLNEFIREVPLDKISLDELKSQYIIFSVVEAVHNIARNHSYYGLNETEYINLDTDDIFRKPDIVDDYYSSNVVCPPQYVIEQIIQELSLKKWQLKVETHNNIPMYELHNFIGILLPELENNIFYMDSVMKRYGYYAAVKAGYKQDGMYWTYVIYNPVDKFNCNEWIKNKISMLYHITSVEAANKITETGLLPFMSHGENRVYLYGNDYHNKQFLEMMIGSLKTRHGTTTGAIIPVRPTVVNSVDFYYDPNFSQAVFCTDPISTEYIDIDGIMVVNLQTIL